MRPETVNNYIPSNARVVAAAVVAGVIAGLATFGLKSCMGWLSAYWMADMSYDTGNFRYLFMPLAGILLAVLYQKLIKEDLAHGTLQIKHRLANGQYDFKRNHMISPLVGCLMTVGFGGSAGAEGPSAFSGAAIGDRISRWFHLSPGATRILFGCGAAAGIAGIFKSPVGGIFFAIEVLRMELSVLGLVAVTCACLSAFSVAYILSGFTWNVTLVTQQQFIPAHIGWIVLLGILCGFYSIYYSYTQKQATLFFSRISNVWAKAIISGTGLGLVIFLLPSMFGEGYDVVAKVVNGIKTPLLEYSAFYSDAWRLPVLLVGIGAVLILKGAAVGATNSGGGVAGEFAPTIFAGCLFGYLFALAANACFDVGLTPENFALIGTAAVMAGTIKAPLMAIFIAAEISDRYNFILAFIAAALFSYLVVEFFSRLRKNNGSSEIAKSAGSRLSGQK